MDKIDYLIYWIPKLMVIFLLVILMAACSTTLRCGTDGQSKYVEIINVPSYYEIKNYTELCYGQKT